MRTWEIERRRRTRHLIELGGLVIKSGVVNLTDDDRAAIYGALIWMVDKLKSEDGERARELWAGRGAHDCNAHRPAPFLNCEAHLCDIFFISRRQEQNI